MHHESDKQTGLKWTNSTVMENETFSTQNKTFCEGKRKQGHWTEPED
jgi:hypothetical protein